MLAGLKGNGMNVQQAIAGQTRHGKHIISLRTGWMHSEHISFLFETSLVDFDVILSLQNVGLGKCFSLKTEITIESIKHDHLLPLFCL